MPAYRTTVVGSYPRADFTGDTLKKPTLTDAEVTTLVEWAARDQASLGLDTITDGEGYRENMYYFYQRRLDGLSFENMVKKTFGNAGFGIECARVTGEIKNPRCQLARWWKTARAAAPTNVRVKQTVTGPHVLARFSVNERPDLYPDEQALCRAYAKILSEELTAVIDAGCDFVQFDEPMWTESPDHAPWAADILNELIDSLKGRARIGLHVCGGNPRRKRVYFTRYHDLVPAFAKVKINEVSLEHCTLSYDLMTLWDQWKFKGDLALGVIDQRSDDLETTEVIRKRIEPALAHFPRERLVLTSECGFGHVPLPVTHAKLKALVTAAKTL